MYWHVGTNDLHTDKSVEVFANEIINLSSSIKNSHYVKKKKILYCDNSGIKSHFNDSGLHLNQSGTIVLANNFLECLNY